MSRKWFWHVQTRTACGEGCFIWNFSLTGKRQLGCLVCPKPGGKSYQQPDGNISLARSGHGTQTFYQAGDAGGWRGGRETAAFLAADIAAFREASSGCELGTQESWQPSLSPPSQPQLIIRKSGILKQTEWTPHIELVAMRRCSHFGEQLSGSSDG